MKVIVAGYSKTGTKSMSTALKQLGYNVYDYLEHYTEHGDNWVRIFNEGGTTEDFKRMYENVDAVTDVPACLFWDEIHKAFPNAKIVLTIRDSEEIWCKSMKTQFEAFAYTSIPSILKIFPSYRRFRVFNKTFFPLMAGFDLNRERFLRYGVNEMVLKMKYRRHNAHVIQNAPKDKLMVFNVKQGWEPLCEFLGVEVPNTPFPHDNVGGEIAKKWGSRHLFTRMQTGVIVAICSVFFGIIYGGYKLAS